MIITQKFHSVKDIDSEFIPSLEELLCDSVPSFNYLKEYEVSAADTTHFVYYLFFGNKHNAPIGFAQLKIEQTQKSETNFFAKIFKKNTTKSKTAIWTTPGSLPDGFIFDPLYSKHALRKTESIIKEYIERKDIDQQTVIFNSSQKNFNNYSNSTPNVKEKTIIETLLKNESDYQSYIDSLSKDSNASIKSEWKFLHTEGVKLNDSNTLKELFTYKTSAATQYKMVKKDLSIKKYNKLETTYVGLEKDGKIVAMVFYIKGRSGHRFFDFVNFEGENYPSSLLNQIAIMKFYEDKEGSRLHLLHYTDSPQSYTDLGFTTRKQLSLTVTE